MRLEIRDGAINDLQVESIKHLVRRVKQAHFTDIIIRINGKDEKVQADWLKHLTFPECD